MVCIRAKSITFWAFDPHFVLALEDCNLSSLISTQSDWYKNGLILPTGQWYAPSADINDALYCIVLHGIAWYCMVLYGIAWYCMALFGISGIAVHWWWVFFSFVGFEFSCVDLNGVLQDQMTPNALNWVAKITRDWKKHSPAFSHVKTFWKEIQK